MTSPRGLLTPFRRDRKRDFATAEGDPLLASTVLQVLATEGATLRSSGELPWRTAFGTPLQLLRHQRNDAALGALARVYIRDALRRWLPEAEVVGVRADQVDAEVFLAVRVRAGQALSTVRLPLLDGAI